MRLAQSINMRILLRPLKAYEVLLFYFAASAFWHNIFSTWLCLLPNMEYFEYPATALTTLQLTKWIDFRDLPINGKFLGESLSRSAVTEIIFVAAVSVAIGVGAWSTLVFLEAKIINPRWAYQFWELIDIETFRSIKWERDHLIANIICVALLAPISEEIIFRGIILKKLLKKHSPVTAVLICSIIFAFFHLNHSFLGTFFHSILFSILAIQLSSLYAPMIAHGLYNLSVLILRSAYGISLVSDISKINDPDYWENEFLLLFFGISLASLYIYFCVKNPRFKAN